MHLENFHGGKEWYALCIIKKKTKILPMSIGFSPQRIKTIIHGKDNDNQHISNPFSKG